MLAALKWEEQHSVGGSVEPGQQAELSVTLTAPTTAGQYTGYLAFIQWTGATSESKSDVLINVDESAVAPLATLAPIATLAPTSTLALIAHWLLPIH